MQFCVKRLTEMMTKPRKLCNPRLARLARHLVGTQKLTLRSDHQEYNDIVSTPVDSDWAGNKGTNDLDGPTHQRLLQKLPLKPTQCRRLLGLIATANGGSAVEARMSGDEEEFMKLSAQVMMAILVAFLTRVIWNTLRQNRFSTTAPARRVERGTRSKLNPIDEIVIPTSVHCSRRGECCHTSRKCEGRKNMPMNAVR